MKTLQNANSLPFNKPHNLPEQPKGVYIQDIAVANYCDKLVAQRDELLAALRDLVAINENGFISPELPNIDVGKGWEMACQEFANTQSLNRAKIIIAKCE